MTAVLDTMDQMIRCCEPSHQDRLLLMSELAANLTIRELRDAFDQYLNVNSEQVATIFAANAFEIFLSEKTRIAAGGRLIKNLAANLARE